MPSLSSVRTLSTCCLLVSGFFTEIAQHIHSLRARGVRSSHEALASASEARVFRKSSGNSWTTPPEISLLVIVIRLYYYKIASLARIAGANGVFNLPVFSRAEFTKMVCKCSLVERLDLLPMAVLLMIGGKLPAQRAKSTHLGGLSHLVNDLKPPRFLPRNWHTAPNPAHWDKVSWEICSSSGILFLSIVNGVCISWTVLSVETLHLPLARGRETDGCTSSRRH